MDDISGNERPSVRAGSAREVFAAFLKLGVTSIGGPIAHLGYFRDELVIRRRWIDDSGFAELLALCQFLPGPASSQAGFALGLMRAGPLGGLAAWTAFTFPSAALMFGFAAMARHLEGDMATAVLHGLKLAAVAIVAQALFGMARTLVPDWSRRTIALAAAAGMLVLASPVTQIGFIALGALSGLLVCTPKVRSSIGNGGWIPTRRASFLMLTGTATILLLLPVAGRGGSLFELAGIFYRAGALVFGGGHVVLPLLHAELVPGFVDDTAFLTGYGAAQALPGPLFALSAYLGAVGSPDAPLAGGLIAIVAIFLPGLLLVAGALPFRAAIAKNARAQAAIMGVNAVVVGILAAALYDPLWTSGVKSFADALIVGVGLLIVLRFRCPPLALVAGTVGAALALAVI
ncbi:chromate efflux transporter [uncultured Sphingopyxis sp.]|jgi:chromate transporter|uniref:chromate efflux transporter n=1 Tax=uncultured Sphingopyxis sp. TaxID=310581 RepID=UPI000AEDF4B2|nr:chromate efflux transporter [uncultured Sphingopyxis sp.]